jgi:serine/threonine protein kinase
VIGQTISHYCIVEKLGGGGMGVVYKAEDTELGRFVALKFLPNELSRDQQALERFRREARLASALNHPNICTIYEIAEEDGREFIAMEYLEGQTLGTQIASRALSSEGVSRMAIPIAEALNAAHAKGVVHRDVKPGNIFVTSSGLVKVLDFGVAKLIEGSAGLVTEELTVTHAIAGTVAYMAPEQLRGEAVDARSDIYSLGVVLFEMATGHKLYSAKSQLELANEILNQPVQPPSLINPKIASKLEEIILKCLDKDPENRYQTAK